MHDHQVVEIVDPEIFVLVVTHGSDGVCGGFPGIFVAHPSGSDFAVKIGQHRVGGFNQIAYLGFPIFQHALLAVDEENGKQDNQCANGSQRHGGQFAA